MLQYLARGWAVFPVYEVANGACACGDPNCESPAKHPRTRNGFQAASKHPGVVEAWQASFPRANTGVRTGRESSLVVLDLDIHKPGVQVAVEAWLGQHGGQWGDPAIARTGSGGLHLYYAYPSLDESLKVATVKGLQGVAGLDVRADGGYVLAPPSVNLGGEYTWLSDRAPGPLPDAILAALLESRKVPAAPVQQAEWRPVHLPSYPELATYQGPYHEALKAALQGQPWARNGEKHKVMLGLVVGLQDAFGPIDPSAGEYFRASCDAARARDGGGASPEQWGNEFQKWWARGEAEHARKAADLRLSESIGVAMLSVQKMLEQAAQEASPVTRETLKALAKKAKDPNYAAILKAVSTGTEIQSDLVPALEACGRWVGQKVGVEVMRHLTHLDADQVVAFRKGVEQGQVLANDKEAWKRQLVRSAEEVPLACMANVLTLLKVHPDMAGSLVFDTRAANFRWVKPAPWARLPDPFLCGSDGAECAAWATRVTGVPFGSAMCYEALTSLRAGVLNIDPVERYLRGLVWDGAPRLDLWLSVLCGAADTPYVRAVARKTLIAAVARAIKPGCMVHTVLVLEGLQGAGKSTVIKNLLPTSEWYTSHEGVLTSRDKDALQRIATGPWLVELEELAGLSRSDVNATKAFLSKEEDRFRVPYGRTVEAFPRRTLFIGTTNENEYLQDTTGNRRWWPVKCGECHPQAVASVRDQLWAEAVAAYDAGEKWWLEGETVRMAAGETADRLVGDPWDEELSLYLDKTPGPVSTRDVLMALGIASGQVGTAETRRVRGCLVRAGWAQDEKKTTHSGVYTKFWRRAQ
jgi:hypothetical protein